MKVERTYKLKGERLKEKGILILFFLSIFNFQFSIASDTVFVSGEVGVILVNLSGEPQTIEAGERICQMIIARHETPEVVEVQELSETERGEGGFGHSGRK